MPLALWLKQSDFLKGSLDKGSLGTSAQKSCALTVDTHRVPTLHYSVQGRPGSAAASPGNAECKFLDLTCISFPTAAVTNY